MPAVVSREGVAEVRGSRGLLTRAGTAAVTLCPVLLAGCSTEPDPPPSRIGAPYVYVGWGELGAAGAAAATPVRHFVLSFLLADQDRCAPVWGSGRAVEDPALLSEIGSLREAGGSVTVASGGANGTYLENSCSTAGELADAYQAALRATGADRLDLDIEKDIPVDLVADALSMLRDRADIGITATVKVLDAQRGLEPSAVRFLRALADRDIDVIVNAMVMNFHAGDQWRASLLAAAETVTDQIQQVWPDGGREGAYRRLGLTFMAGRNDTGVVTTLDDAQALRDYSRRHNIGFLGFWSLSRDNGKCPGHPEASNHCSGIMQEQYAFTRSLM